MSSLSQSELRALIAIGETTTFELKIAPPRASELAERICGMANGRGGRIVIGVEDATLTIVGVPKPAMAVDMLLRAARLVTPTIAFDPPEPECIAVDGKTVVMATIHSSWGPIYQAGGVCWIRRGTNTIPLTVDEVLALAGTRGLVAWEQRSAPYLSFDDINPQYVERYLVQRPMHSRLPHTSLADILSGLNCVSRETPGKSRPNNAAILFFGHTPQQHIRHSDVMCVLFRDTQGVQGYIDQRVVTGPLPELIDGTVAFVDKHLAVSGQVTGWKRHDTPEYPIKALREAITNAIIHRDYTREGESVRVYFYPDRIEIRSPGLLMPPVTLADMAQGQVSSKLRNPILANLLHDLPGYMERMGSGIRLMLHEMAQLRLPPPEFTETTEFVVTFRSSAQMPLVAQHSDYNTIAPDHSRETLVPELRYEIGLRHIRQHGRITATHYAFLTGTSLTTAIRDLEYLIKAGVIRSEGHTRGKYYRLP